MHAYKLAPELTHARTHVPQRNERIQIMKRNGRTQTNKQTIKSIQCVHWEQQLFVSAPWMYRITHGASSISKLNANMWLNIKAIDFRRGLKRKFIRSVDSFKLNANAECHCWRFGCCCCRCYCCGCGYAQLSRLPNTNSAQHSLFVWFHWNENIWATYVQAQTVNISLHTGIHSK